MQARLDLEKTFYKPDRSLLPCNKNYSKTNLALQYIVIRRVFDDAVKKFTTGAYGAYARGRHLNVKHSFLKAKFIKWLTGQKVPSCYHMQFARYYLMEPDRSQKSMYAKYLAETWETFLFIFVGEESGPFGYPAPKLYSMVAENKQATKTEIQYLHRIALAVNQVSSWSIDRMDFLIKFRVALCNFREKTVGVIRDYSMLQLYLHLRAHQIKIPKSVPDEQIENSHLYRQCTGFGRHFSLAFIGLFVHIISILWDKKVHLYKRNPYFQHVRCYRGEDGASLVELRIIISVLISEYGMSAILNDGMRLRHFPDELDIYITKKNWAHLRKFGGKKPTYEKCVKYHHVDPTRVYNTTVAVAKMNQCHTCKKWDVDGNRIQLCGGCFVTKYCSKRCQKRDWNLGDHRSECKRFQTLAQQALDSKEEKTEQ